MKHYFILILLSVALGFSACESESPIGYDDPQPEIEITPSKIRVGLYETYTVKARIKSRPLSEVNIVIDFGDGQPQEYNVAGYAFTHKYSKTGTYVVTVSAFNMRNDSPYGKNYVSVTVTDTSPRVTFTRDLIDTTYQLDRVVDYSYVSFPFTTNTTIGKVRYQFGDGYAFTDSLYYYKTMSYVYQAPGTHKVIIDVYNEKQEYWASDTMTCIIRLPEVTLDMLTSAINISVGLAVDKTSPVYESFNVSREIKVGISAPYFPTSKITWAGNSFHASYTSGSITAGYLEDCQFTGTISNDRQKLETMTVSAYDSANWPIATKYGYKLFNLELCGMSDRVIVYRAAYRPLSTFVSDEYCSGEISDARKLGQIFNLPTLPDIRYSRPYAYVSFTRKSD